MVSIFALAVDLAAGVPASAAFFCFLSLILMDVLIKLVATSSSISVHVGGMVS